MKRIFDNDIDSKRVEIHVYKDEEAQPIQRAVADISPNGKLSVALDLNVFLSTEATYGNLCRYTVAIKPYKGLK
jgi:hypothetical protein